MENTSEPLIHTLDETGKQKNSVSILSFVIIIIAVVAVGGVFGFILAQLKQTPSSSSTSTSKARVTKTIGIVDKKTFKDNAEGLLKEGGIDGEGNFHLERPGGISQNVYLTSTTVDLSQYVEKKVRVWGETFQAKKAGWLMDVGLVEILQ